MLACIRVYDIKIITMIVQCWPLQPSAYDCLNTAFIEEIQQKSGVIWCKTFGNIHSMMRNIKLNTFVLIYHVVPIENTEIMNLMSFYLQVHSNSLHSSYLILMNNPVPI